MSDRPATAAAPSPLAGRLRDITDRVRRLPPPDRRDPERFHLERDCLAADLRHLARAADQPVSAAARVFPIPHR